MQLLKPLKSIWRVCHRIVREKGQRNFLNAIMSLPNSPSIQLIDIGAAEDIEPRWKKIAPVLDYVGFEPDERSSLELQARGSTCKTYTVISKAVWDVPGSIEINLCRKPTCSSHFAPNQPFLDQFADSKRFHVDSIVTVETTRLDDLFLTGADFIKMDIQGGELHALKGGVKLLEKALGLELEVEFLPLYKGQPLYGEIVTFLSNQGFEFIDFVNLCRWERAAFNDHGQCVFGDALFLRTPENILKSHAATSEAIGKYLAICLLYNRFDLIDHMTSLIDVKSLKEFAPFIHNLAPIRRRQLLARRISSTASILLNFVDHEYRSHLIS